MDGSARNTFHQTGWILVPGVLSSSAISAFVNDVADELTRGGGHYIFQEINQSWGPKAVKSIRIADRNTWPAGKERRVVEVAPDGEREYWLELGKSPQFCAVLTALLGNNSYEFPLNEVSADGQMQTRHWYCPVTFPEGGSTFPATCSPTSRVALLGPAQPSACVDDCTTGPAQRWQAVSRRRVLSKGWHLDVGPGFPNDGLRTSAGDRRQGIVMLILLSDCGPGEGGTALLPGSHLWVLRELERAEEVGVPHTHESANLWAVRHLRTATEAGRVHLPPQHTFASECTGCQCGTWSTRESKEKEESGDGQRAALYAEHADPLGPVCTLPLHVVQIVGKAGDVILCHPLLLHGGTQVCGERPRLLANGVVRYRKEVWEDPAGLNRQCGMLARDMTYLRSMLIRSSSLINEV